MDNEIQLIYTKIDDLKKQVDHVKRELQSDRDKNNRRRQNIISRVDKEIESAKGGDIYTLQINGNTTMRKLAGKKKNAIVQYIGRTTNKYYGKKGYYVIC